MRHRKGVTFFECVLVIAAILMLSLMIIGAVHNIREGPVGTAAPGSNYTPLREYLPTGATDISSIDNEWVMFTLKDRRFLFYRSVDFHQGHAAITELSKEE